MDFDSIGGMISEISQRFTNNVIKAKINQCTKRRFLGKGILLLNDPELYELIRILQEFGISIEFGQFDFTHEIIDDNVSYKYVQNCKLIYRGKEIDNIDEVMDGQT